MAAGLAGCTTAADPSTVSEKDSQHDARGRKWDIEGFAVYDGQQPLRSFTIIGYVRYDAVGGTPREAVFRELKKRAVVLGGNALIDVRRETLLDTGEKTGVQDLGIRDISGFGSGAIVERHRWRATVVFIPE